MGLLIDIEGQIKKIDVLSKKGFFGKLVGEYRSAFKGKGLEFTGYRNYDSSDDAIRIDWKASLRSQDLLVREFEEERNLNVIFLFDTSNSMLYSSNKKLKAEYAAELIGALSYGILQADDSVGLIMFNDKIKSFVKPHIGSKQFFSIASELKNEKNYGGNKNFKRALNFCMSALSRTTIIFLVTDFINLPSDYKSFLESFLEHFEVIGLMIRDPNDDEFPEEGLVTLMDPFTGKELTVAAEEVKYHYDYLTYKFLSELESLFKKLNSDILKFYNNSDFLKIFLEYFKKRKKKKEIRVF